MFANNAALSVCLSVCLYGWTDGRTDGWMDALFIPREIQVSSSIQNTKHTLHIH